MDRITIDPKDIKANGNSTFSLLHDATSLVTFEEGMSNPLKQGWCFALYFHKFDIGVCIRQVRCSVDSHFERVKMFKLGKFELSRFNVPAEFMCPASSWEDWKSPLTKHITLNHLQPGILISPTVDGDKKSVQVSMSIKNQGPGINSISTNTGILKLIP